MGSAQLIAPTKDSSTPGSANRASRTGEENPEISRAKRHTPVTAQCQQQARTLLAIVNPTRHAPGAGSATTLDMNKK